MTRLVACCFADVAESLENRHQMRWCVRKKESGQIDVDPHGALNDFSGVQRVGKLKGTWANTRKERKKKISPRFSIKLAWQSQTLAEARALPLSDNRAWEEGSVCKISSHSAFFFSFFLSFLSSPGATHVPWRHRNWLQRRLAASVKSSIRAAVGGWGVRGEHGWHLTVWRQLFPETWGDDLKRQFFYPPKSCTHRILKAFEIQSRYTKAINLGNGKKGGLGKILHPFERHHRCAAGVGRRSVQPDVKAGRLTEC